MQTTLNMSIVEKHLLTKYKLSDVLTDASSMFVDLLDEFYMDTDNFLDLLEHIDGIKIVKDNEIIKTNLIHL